MIITNELDNYRFTYREIANPLDETFSKHMHHYYEILFFVSGGVKYVVEDKAYILQPYDILLIQPTEYHFANICSSNPYIRYTINFTSEYTDKKLLEEVFSRGKYFHLDKNSHITRIFETMTEFYSEPNQLYNKIACKTLLTEVLLHLNHLQQVSDSPTDHVTESTCATIVEYISNNLSTIKTLDDIVNHFFISKSSLTHQFKENMGISIMKYIRNKRLMLAQTLLRRGKKPTEIFEQCGFQDYATFFRAYVSFFGKKPSERL